VQEEEVGTAAGSGRRSRPQPSRRRCPQPRIGVADSTPRASAPPRGM
jgi:hypothetical protein